MFDDTILNPLRYAIHNAKREGWKILNIHVTHDFYMRIKAQCTPPVPNIQKPFEYPVLGYSVIEHMEPCKEDWWIEIEKHVTINLPSDL